MIDNVLTGRKIAELRLGRGLTQQQLAALMGVSHQAVSKWESGQALPDIQTMLALTEFFGITIEQLITEKGDISETSAEAPSAETTESERIEATEVKEMNAAQLLQMAPFMSKEAVEEIALGISDPMTAQQLSKFGPFVSTECLEELIARHQPELDWENLRRLAPFMSREAVDALARRIASGETSVRPNADPFGKAINDIGKCFDGIGRDLGKTLDGIGKGIEKGFDDFGKGVDKAVRKAVKFGENVINEVNKAINAEEVHHQEEKARSERIRSLRSKAFERAIRDGNWDWAAQHAQDYLEKDAELKSMVVEAARTAMKEDWLRAHVSGYADIESVESAIAAGDWEWLGENVWQFGGDVHEKAALAALEVENWDWLIRYSDQLELVDCIETIANAALAAGQNAFCAQFADGHMIESQVDELAGTALDSGNYEAFRLLAKQCSTAFREKALAGLAEAGEWGALLKLVQYADEDLIEKLMEAAVDQGNFEAIDMLDALL